MATQNNDVSGFDWGFPAASTDTVHLADDFGLSRLTMSVTDTTHNSPSQAPSESSFSPEQFSPEEAIEDSASVTSAAIAESATPQQELPSIPFGGRAGTPPTTAKAGMVDATANADHSEPQQELNADTEGHARPPSPAAHHASALSPMPSASGQHPVHPVRVHSLIGTHIHVHIHLDLSSIAKMGK